MAEITTQSVRRPRGIVRLGATVGGMKAIEGWTFFEIENNSFFSADSFRITFVASSLPSDRDANWFTTQTDMYIELLAGFPADPNAYTAAELTSWILGQVDQVDFNPVTGVIEVSGRDLTRVFIDAKTSQKWVNLTSSQIAQQLAASHGLSSKVTRTTTKAGKFYEIDHTSMPDARSEWDVLCYLASNEGFIVYVRGTTLYFGPGPAADATPYQLIWIPGQGGWPPSANFENLVCSRALTVSRGIQVVIRSFNHRQQKGFTAQYPAKSKTIQAGKSTTFGGTQLYSRVIPNLTHEQALQAAQALYKQLVKQEMKITVDLPGDVDLDMTSVVTLSGTGTAFDQTYYPDAVTRSMNFDGGFVMHMSAKNHSPESEVSL